ncbi:MAG: hypothetical protein BWY00_00008 [Firmicutes bacterium ADurb.Bin153]|nr:MAG: hypothetical protein BWY00_00008 [Firmicutes bacterium ADurb.Bin153]HPU96023.1 hypothetical protein [Bacillota bacterium]
MFDLFELFPLVFGIIWFLVIVSVIVRIVKAVTGAAKNKGGGFDPETVRGKLEEIRKAIEESQASQEGKGKAVVTRGLEKAEGPFTGPARGPYPGIPAPMPQPVAGRVIRSRFEESRPEQAQLAEGEGQPSEEGFSGSLPGTSSESIKEWKGLIREDIEALTPFQKELSERSMEGFGTEGLGMEEPPSTVRGVDTFETWAKEPVESIEGEGLEVYLKYLSGIGEPEHVDLVGGINMKEMADAIVWAEIMTRPLAKRPIKGFRTRRAY